MSNSNRNGWYDIGYAVKNHYVDGHLHSIDDNPSSIYITGTKVWHKKDNKHRETGPARIWLDGHKEYWFDGKCYPDITSDLEWMMKVEEIKNSA